MAAGGTTCPYCKEYASLTVKGKLYVHKSGTLTFSGNFRLECRASRMTPSQATRLRQLVDEGTSVWVAMRMIRDEENEEC